MQISTTTTQTPRRSAENDKLSWDRGGLRATGAALVAGALVTGVFNALHPLPADDPVATMRGIVDAGILFWKLDHLMLMVGFWLLAWGFIGLRRLVPEGPGAIAARLGLHGVLMGTAAWTVHDAIDGFARAEVAAAWAAAPAASQEMHAAIGTTVQHVTDATFPLIALFYWLSLALLGAGLARARALPALFGSALALVGALVSGLAAYALFFGFGPAWDAAFATGATLTVVWALVAGVVVLRRARV